MVADIRRVEITDDDVQALKQAMLTMPAHPDVEDGLIVLRDNGFRLVTLTNSPPEPDRPSPLEHAGLSHLFERQLSVDACRAFKPAPAVYVHACEQLAVSPSDCMMVAAHVWDTIGAQSVGFSGALITRPGNAALPVSGLPQPMIVATDLRDLAAKLTNQRDPDVYRVDQRFNEHRRAPMTTMTATTRHVVIDSPIGPLTLVRDDDRPHRSVLPRGTGPSRIRPASGRRSNRATTAASTRPSPSCANTSPVSARTSICRSISLAANGPAHSGSCSPRSPTVSTTTYGALAGKIGNGISPRDIGGFVGHNPLSIFIPCHRVVGSTGKLTGYAGGLDRKQYLLELENAIPVAPQSLW